MSLEYLNHGFITPLPQPRFYHGMIQSWYGETITRECDPPDRRHAKYPRRPRRVALWGGPFGRHVT